ncbi:MAG TPA: PAS domain-containing protein, partial [Burkholderiaceae bacterium]|nr:PAS domain-containing protein [Burkholderiaceae bacterium]
MRPAAHSIARFAVWAALVAAGAVLATQGASAAALVMLASLFVAAVSWALVGPAVALVAVAALHALIAALPAPFAPELGLAPQAASMAAGWAAVALLHGLLGPRRGAIPHRLLLERIPGIVYVHDLRRDVPLFLSAAARARAGGTGAGAPAMHPDDLPRVREHLAQLDRSADDDARQIDYQMRDADGSFRWFRSTDAVLRNQRK